MSDTHVELFAKKTPDGYYIVNKQGLAVDKSGRLVYHPVSCEKDEYPEYASNS